MAALTTARDTPRNGDRAVSDLVSIPLKANAKVFQGGIVCVDATGYGVAGATSTTLLCVGIAQKSVDNTGGSNGTLSVDVRRGCFKLNNSAAGDLIAQASVMTSVFLVDDNTVAKTNGGSTRSAAGVVIQIDPDGSPWVELGIRSATGV